MATRRNDLSIVEGKSLTTRRSEGRRNADYLILDGSSSMGGPMTEGRSKFDCLRIACEPYAATNAQGIVFSDRAAFCELNAIPFPGGCTDLEAGLQMARGREPLHVLVISDGQPTCSQEACLDQVKAMDCITDCMYIGPLDDEVAITFMKNLASAGRGRYFQFDVTAAGSNRLLESKVTRMLAIAPPSKIQL